jgi:Tfp pilus assembly protein PilF
VILPQVYSFFQSSFKDHGIDREVMMKLSEMASTKCFVRCLAGASLLFAFCAFTSHPAAAQQLVSSGHGVQQQQVPSTADTDMPVITPELSADLLAAHQNYQGAIDAYSKLPPSAALYNKMGIAFQRLGKISEARFYYDKAIKLDRQFAPAYNNYGTLEFHDRDMKHAERLYRKSIKIDGKTASFWSNLGAAYLADGKYRDAAEAYQRAFIIDSGIFDEIAINGVREHASEEDLAKMDLCFAAIYAQAGMKNQAVEYLRKAFVEGYHDKQSLQQDQQFATLHGDPAFEQLLKSQQTK